MPRKVDVDVSSAFVEFPPSDEHKCHSVQCIYCQQIRAKNTTRQRQHLLQCAGYLNAHPDVALQASAANNGAPEAYPTGDVSAEHTNLSFVPNPRINSSLGQRQDRPELGPDAPPAPPAKKQKTKQAGDSNLPEIPLREVHAAFEEFKAKEDDKCISARCLYCNQVRAKNTSRQREHLMHCPGYQSVLKDKIPANNLRHQFEVEDVASSIALPAPSIDLDFRLSIRVKPKINVGAGSFGWQSWVSCVGGQWAGRWGKGVLLPGGQDTQTTVKGTATRIDARYLMQTSDEHPAMIICIIKGWLTADRDVMERLQDPVAADNVAANRYKLRVTIELETGDERYQEINTGVWVGSGCRRGAEIVYDAYRIG